MRRTIAHLGHAQHERFGDSVFFYHFHDDRFRPVTWRQAAARGDRITAGLHALGCGHGDKIAIVSETRAEWSSLDLATLTFGGVVVGIYPTSTTEQLRYILDHCEARVVFVENALQLEKVATIRAQLPALQNAIVIDSDDSASDDDLLTLATLEAQGERALADDPQLVERLRDAVQPDDVASLVYTSGTTGPPKGVVLTHKNFYEISDAAQRAMGLSRHDVGVVFLPLAHSLQRVAAYAGLRAGSAGYYCPNLERLLETWQAAQPTVVSSVPRIFEKMHSRIMQGLAQQTPRRQALFNVALGIGKRRSEAIQRKERVPLHIDLAYSFFDKLIFSKIRQRTFGGRVRYLVSGGAPISKELLEFFHAVGYLILEGYGLTETSAPATLNRPHDFRFGSVGRVLDDVEVEIASDGEIMIRGPGLFTEYYKDPQATAEAIEADGWFHSGDIGEIDDDGFLSITDRKKDLIITAGGKNIAPQNIENLIKTDPRISQVMVHGDKRKFLVALITLDEDEMKTWAKENGCAEDTIAALATDQRVIDAVGAVIEEKNRQLARYESIKKFRILPGDFSVENGMLTPTLKVKRRVIEGNYRELLDELYA